MVHEYRHADSEADIDCTETDYRIA
jgi:hypothetical protein